MGKAHRLAETRRSRRIDGVAGRDAARCSTRGVSIAFGGVQRAARRLAWTFRRGAIVAVIGPNGAGKTTLFNCITGVYRPDAGDVKFAGQPLVGKKPHEVAALGLARTFQNIELFARMTVLDNVLLGRHRHMKTGPLSAMLFGRGVQARRGRAAPASRAHPRFSGSAIHARSLRRPAALRRQKEDRARARAGARAEAVAPRRAFARA